MADNMSETVLYKLKQRIVAQFSRYKNTSLKEWQDHGHWEVISANGVIILYTFDMEKSTLMGESNLRIPHVGIFSIYKMEQERMRRNFPSGDI